MFWACLVSDKCSRGRHKALPLLHNLGRGDPEGEGAPLTELAGNGNVAFIDGE
jgi:hypothetical protein